MIRLGRNIYKSQILKERLHTKNFPGPSKLTWGVFLSPDELVFPFHSLPGARGELCLTWIEVFPLSPTCLYWGPSFFPRAQSPPLGGGLAGWSWLQQNVLAPLGPGAQTRDIFFRLFRSEDTHSPVFPPV